MTENSQKKKLGAPHRHPVDRLRTKVWYYGIVSRFENLTAFKLELMFNREKVRYTKEGAIQPGNFQQYKHGKQRPKDRDKANSFISKVDNVFAGTAAIFRSPIWDILKGKRVDTPTIQRSMEALGQITYSLFLEPPNKHGLNGTLIKDFTEQDFAAIRGCYLFPSLQAIILMIHYFDRIANLEIRNHFVELYRSMIPDFIEETEVPFFHEFFDVVDQIAYRREFGQFSQELKVFISWRDLYPDLALRPVQRPR